MPTLTNNQVIEALRELGHEAEAEALAAKTAEGAEPPAEPAPETMDEVLRRAAGRA